MHAQLGIGHLHAAHKFFDLIGQGVEVVAIALKREHRGLVGPFRHIEPGGVDRGLAGGIQRVQR